jgi:hypothetical protein
LRRRRDDAIAAIAADAMPPSSSRYAVIFIFDIDYFHYLSFSRLHFHAIMPPMPRHDISVLLSPFTPDAAISLLLPLFIDADIDAVFIAFRHYFSAMPPFFSHCLR